MFREYLFDGGNALLYRYVGVKEIRHRERKRISESLMSRSERRLLKCRLSRIQEGIEVAIG